MTLLILLGLVVVGYYVYRLWVEADPSPPQPIDPEQEQKAALELQAIRRCLDQAELRGAQRRDLERLKRELAEVLEEEGTP